MADLRLTQLTEDTSPTSDDIVYVVNNPSGTPTDRKVTVGNLAKGMSHTNLTNIGTNTHAQIDTFIGKVYPKFRATLSSDQSISASTWTKINFDTETFDTNNNYDTTNKRFTPTASGYYLITITIGSSISSDANIWIGFYKNGSSVFQPRCMHVAPVSNHSITEIMYFNGSSDYVEAYIYYNNAGTVQLDSSSFSGAKLMD